MSIITAATRPKRHDEGTVAQKRADLARRRLRAYVTARLTMWDDLSRLLSKFTLAESLEVIRRGHSENGKRPNNAVAMAAETWLPKIRNNQPLSDVIAGAVTDRERLVISVAQLSPNFPQVLQRLHQAESAMGEVKDKWRASIREPLVILALTWAMMTANAYGTIAMMGLYPNGPRGWAAVGLNTSSFIFYWVSWVAPIVVCALVLIYRGLLKHWLSENRVGWEVVWPFSLYKRLHALDFLLALTILALAGKDIPAALRSMRATAPKYLVWQIDAIEPLARDQPLGAAVMAAGRNFPDAQVNALFEIYSTDPIEFPKRLSDIADDYLAKLLKRIDTNRKVTGFFAILLVGLIQVLTSLLMLAGSIPN
ncbi:MAG TPA: hypothetical protein VGU69_10455 [Rhizomicrobium sp.]|nr:hypothetical protein [Rhizomicrobium sp.]